MSDNIKINSSILEEDIDKIFIEFFLFIESGGVINKIINLRDVINNSVFLLPDKIIINPGEHIRALGYNNGVYKVKYNFFKKVVGWFDKKFIIKKISPSRKEIEIVLDRSNELDNNYINNFLFFNYVNLNNIQQNNSFNNILQNVLDLDFLNLRYYAFFGNDVNCLIVNKKDNGSSILIKLKDELPLNINLYDKFFIVEKILDSFEDSFILKTEIVQKLNDLNVLSGPKINYKSAGILYRSVPPENYFSLLNLKNSDNFFVKKLIYTHFSSSLIEGIDLNIDYRNFSNFVHFSSAERRLNNFRKKISKIEFINSKINYFSSNNIVKSSSLETIDYYNNLKDEIINSFDGFERFMYYQSGSYESSSLGVFPDYTWPKYTNTEPYLLFSVTSSQAINWFDSMIVSASLYDKRNPNRLVNTIPADILLDNRNSEYITFIDMIGHIFDINFIYINKMLSIYDRKNDIYTGIPMDLILHAINHYGFNLKSGYAVKKLIDENNI